MPRKQLKKQIKKEYKQCDHDYTKIEGLIICSKCNKKAILYLSPLKKNSQNKLIPLTEFNRIQ